jgi:uncharacterized membrane protein
MLPLLGLGPHLKVSSLIYTFFFSFVLKLKNQLQERNYIKLRGNQEIMPIHGLTFHITKLLWVKIRPLTPPHIKSNFVKDILVQDVSSKPPQCHTRC